MPALRQKGGKRTVWFLIWNRRDYKMFKCGNQVEILPEFQDPGDDRFIWIVLGDEEKGRVDISPVNSDLTIKPIYTVSVDQIKLAQVDQLGLKVKLR